MRKKRFIIFSVLLAASLGCTHSANIVQAEEHTVGIWRTGITTSECILLQTQNPPLYIKVIRSKDDLCADYVEQYNNPECKGEGVFLKGEKGPRKIEAYGLGNQACPESIVVYKKSDPCYEYHSRCRKRYIPRG